MSASTEVIEGLPQTRPADQYNRELVSNVHPLDWVNPEPVGRYNMVVLGGGTAGLVTAAGAAGLGARVALVERALLGGDCLNVGCVPSKALIRCARAYADARDAGEFGVNVSGKVTIDFSAVMERMRRLRAQISHNDSAHRFRELGVDVFIGEARFIGRDTLQVGDKTLRFANACIATGGRAMEPPIDGLAVAGYLTNETLFTLTELPRRFAVVGAGPIGCEIAQTFARFGSKVVLIEMDKQILIHEDRDAAERIEKALASEGVEMMLSHKLTGAYRRGDSKTVVLESKDGKREVTVDEILLGLGRIPNVEGLNLEAAGVRYDKRGVTVNDRLQTANPRVYAAGDVCVPYKFTHTADATARIVIQNALFFGRAKVSALTIPWCTFTDPEIAHVGMYESDAKQRGIETDTFTVELNEIDRAVIDGEAAGCFLKVHTRKGTDKILGATLVARHAGEMISEITTAMVAGAGLGTVAKAIHCYPTQAEVFRRAGDAFNRGRLTARAKKILRKVMEWRR